jgi:SAM-dependent methyltransferase
VIDSAKLQTIRDEYYELKGEWAKSRVERVMQAAAITGGELVLDLACNMGTFSYHTSRAGAKPIGLDRNHIALTEGREISQIIAGLSTPRVCADAGELPFSNGTFDLIINADFIEHTPDDVKRTVFSEMYRVLKVSGRGVVYTPNLNRVRWELGGERLKRWTGLRSSPVPRWQDFVDPDHFGLTTPWKTASCLRAAGFRTVIRYYEFHVPVLSKIPGFNRVAAPIISPQFANRFLIIAWK